MPGDFAKIDAYVEEQARASSLPGVAYAIVENGQIVHMAAFGTAGPDGRAMTAQTPMIIASVGKTITALAVRQLINAGKIEEDAPVQRYLPWFRVADDEASKQITIHHLLFHESGISTLSGNNPALYRPGPSTQELVRSLASVPLNRPVGSSTEYSNINYLILDQVIEAASGMPYEQYVQENIYDPLEMRHSFFSVEDARKAGMGSGYRYYFGLPVAVDVPYPRAAMAGGFHINSAEDMAHYLMAFSNHGFYKELSIVQPDRKQHEGDDQIYYNIDWTPYDLPGIGDAPGHAGGWLNYSSGIIYMPANRIGIVVLANSFPTQWLPAKATNEIAYDVLRLYTGNPPSPARPALTTLYLVVDILILAVAVLAAARFLSLRGWREKLGQRGKGPGMLIAWLLLDLLLPLVLLLVLPVAMASLPGQTEYSPLKNWSRMFFTVPDISAAGLILGMALLGVGLVKLAWIASRKKPGGIAETNSLRSL